MTRIIHYLGKLSLRRCKLYYKKLNLEHLDWNQLFRNLTLDINLLSSRNDVQNLPNLLYDLKIVYEFPFFSNDKILIAMDVLKWIPSTIKYLDMSEFRPTLINGIIKFVNADTHPNLILAKYIHSNGLFYSPLTVFSTIETHYMKNVSDVEDRLGLNNCTKELTLTIDGYIETKTKNVFELAKCYPFVKKLNLNCNLEHGTNEFIIDLPPTLEILEYVSCYEYYDYDREVPTLKISSPNIKIISVEDVLLVFDPNITFSKLTTVILKYAERHDHDENLRLPPSVTYLDLNNVSLLNIFPPNLITLVTNFSFDDRIRGGNRIEWINKFPNSLEKLVIEFSPYVIYDESCPQNSVTLDCILNADELICFYKNLPRGLIELHINLAPNTMNLTIEQAQFLPPKLKTLIVRNEKFCLKKDLIKVLPKSLTYLEFDIIEEVDVNFVFEVLPQVTKLVAATKIYSSKKIFEKNCIKAMLAISI
jgi:hypothetical protein